MRSPIKFLNLDWAPSGDITQHFGQNPKLYARFGLDGHNGVDIVRPYGEPLYAIEDATVVSVKNDPSGYGKNVRFVSDMKNEEGYHREWVYAHNSKNYVKVGDKIKKGQHIADMGNTGFVVSNSTGNGFWKVNPYAGTHLHLGLRETKIMRKGGWSYEGSDVKLKTRNYDNGYKGSIDSWSILKLLESDAPQKNKDIFQNVLSLRSLINRLANALKK